MNDLIKIGNQEISTKEFNGQRVVTFKDIDMVHERPDGTAKRNFRENKEHFIEGEDYFLAEITGDEFRTQFGLGKNAGRTVTLLTEQGYLMVVKSLKDDLAWKVQRELVNTYFRVKKPLSQLEILQQSIEILNRHDQEIKQIDTRMDKLEFDIPLYGSEADELSNHVKRKVVAVLGGKQSEAYKDTNIRSRVYRDIYDQIKREFGLYADDGKPKSYKALKRKYISDAHNVVDAYETPFYLEEMIKDANSQMNLEIA